MGLQEKLDEHKKSFLEKAPLEAVKLMQRATDSADSEVLSRIWELDL